LKQHNNVVVVSAAAVALLAAGSSADAQSSLTFHWKEIGADVVGTATGTIDLAGLAFQFNSGTTGGWLSTGASALGTSGSANHYGGLIWDPASSLATPFRSSGFLAASSSAGTLVRLFDDSGPFGLSVDSAYVSGSAVNATSTWNSNSFAGLGLTAGTWRATYGSSNQHEVKVIFGQVPGAVPEPGEWAAMGILGAGLTGLVIRKRRMA